MWHVEVGIWTHPMVAFPFGALHGRGRAKKSPLPDPVGMRVVFGKPVGQIDLVASTIRVRYWDTETGKIIATFTNKKTPFCAGALGLSATAIRFPRGPSVDGQNKPFRASCLVPSHLRQDFVHPRQVLRSLLEQRGWWVVCVKQWPHSIVLTWCVER